MISLFLSYPKFLEIKINAWGILFSSGLAVGIFLMLLFIHFRKSFTIHAQNITAILFILSLMLFEEFTEQSNLIDCYPIMINLTIIGELLIWPFLLFFIQYLVKERESYNWKDLLYFIPFVFGLIWRIPFLNLSAEEKLDYFSTGIPNEIALFVSIKVIVALAFLIHIHRLLTKKIMLLEPYLTYLKRNSFIINTRKVIIVLGISFLLTYSVFFVIFFGYPYASNSGNISSLLIILIFYFFGIMVYKNPQLFQEDNYSRAIVDFFDGKELEYVSTLQEFFSKEKPYLNEKLAIRDVAKQLNLSSQQLSYLINRHLEVTFLDFINTYRVKEVVGQINNKNYKDHTLLSIAFDCGFNSKASFNRIFKKHIGITPSDYIKNLP